MSGTVPIHKTAELSFDAYRAMYNEKLEEQIQKGQKDLLIVGCLIACVLAYLLKDGEFSASEMQWIIPGLIMFAACVPGIYSNPSIPNILLRMRYMVLHVEFRKEVLNRALVSGFSHVTMIMASFFLPLISIPTEPIAFIIAAALLLIPPVAYFYRRWWYASSAKAQQIRMEFGG